MKQGRERESSKKPERQGAFQGIVVTSSGTSGDQVPRPRISAFIWGGKVRPTPTLPFGRWKGAA